MVTVHIDPHAGFCPGVRKAITIAEELLDAEGEVYCLGELVHCPEEMERLESKGFKIISKEEIDQIQDSKIVIRAHGISPSVQHRLNKTDNEIIDATCNTVYRLQQKVKISSTQMQMLDGQVVIFGKKNHPEVEGLIGYCQSKYLIVSDPENLEGIDLNKPISIFAQTTSNIAEFESFIQNIYSAVRNAGLESNQIQVYNTICTPMKSRVPQLRSFASKFDVIVFVSGERSANGAYLSSICKAENIRTFRVSAPGQLNFQWFENVDSIGVTGGNSSPYWLLEVIADEIKNRFGA